MPAPINPYDQAFLRRQAAIYRRIRDHYESGIHSIIPTLSTIKYKGKVFKLSDYPALQRKVDAMASKLNNQVYATMVNGIKESWDFSNKKNDVLVDKRLSGSRIPKKARQVLYDPNDGALKSYINRKDKGLDLSKRVWNSVEPFKKELEQGLGMGIGSGQSAADMAKDLKRYLNEPDRLFRRVRGEDGKLHLSTAARNYNPGQGVYRSSYKNALRLTRTETNGAYRSSDHERWKTLPFITGIKIQLSDSHPTKDICDHLAGEYPKDFKFQGWHPQCLCFATSIQMTDEEFNKLEDQILAGEPVGAPSQNDVNHPPAAFAKYLKDNQERLARAASTPYWMKDNPHYVKSALSGTVPTPKPEKKPAPAAPPTRAAAPTGSVKPAGNQIGSQFTIPLPEGIRESVKHALSSIDSVHGDGVLDDIPFMETNKANTFGSFYWNEITSKAAKIDVSKLGTHMELTTAHEMGHYLDLYSIGEKGSYGTSQANSPAQRILNAAAESDTIKNIKSILNAKVINYNGIDYPLSTNLRKHLKYLLKPHEIFARSYAQYIAEKSGSSLMASGIEQSLVDLERIKYSHQWNADEFKAISEAFDEMMKELNWTANQ